MFGLLQTIHFWGLPASTVAAIFAAVGTVIVGLYILKLRRRQLEVPFVGFWQQISKDASTSRLFRNLRRWLSLLLALLIAGLLVLALGDPRLFAEREPNRLVILLDVSASMGARSVSPSGDTGAGTSQTRFAKAQNKAKELVASLRGADRAIIVAAGAGPRPLTGLTDRHAVLIQAIEQAEPTGESLEIGKTLRVAADLVAGTTDSRVVLISDGGYVEEKLHVPAGLELSFIRVGDDAIQNVGITSMSARVHPLDVRQNQVFIEVQSSRKQPAEFELMLRTKGRTLSTETITIEAGERIQRTLDDLGGLEESLSAQIVPQAFDDGLEADNQAHVVLPKRKHVRVGVVSEGNLYLQAALLLDEHLDVTEALTVDGLGALDQFDVLIFDNVLPPAPPAKPAIYIDPDDRAQQGYSPLQISGDIERPFVDKQSKEHPLLRWVALRDINIAGARKATLGKADTAVAADRRGPLLVDGQRLDDAGHEHRFFALLFDPRESDLPLRAAWPLLLISMIDELVPQNTDARGSCIAGQACFLPGSKSASVFSNAGVFEFTDGSRDDGEAVSVAVNVDPREASSRGRTTIAGASSEVGAAKVAPSNDRLWVWLVALALILLCVEWWTLQRRRTV